MEKVNSHKNMVNKDKELETSINGNENITDKKIEIILK
jgi:hypothetical protein